MVCSCEMIKDCDMQDFYLQQKEKALKKKMKNAFGTILTLRQNLYSGKAFK